MGTGSIMLTLALLLLWLPEVTPHPHLQCSTVDNTVHNPGEVACVLVSYNDYQWSACSTDDYIMRSSDRKYRCVAGRGIARWHQCMLAEIYGDMGPTVNDECRCSPSEKEPTEVLSPHCYSPGEDCSWYRECLEERYGCEGTENCSYAINFGEKFCNLYSSNYNDFTTEGRAWIDGVRKCLQVALVPSLRPWVSKTCKDIYRDAFNSHPGCYITPCSGAPGICELSCADVWRSFWLVNFEGGAFISAPLETGKQMLSVMAGCFSSGPLSGCIPRFQTALALSLPAVPLCLKLIAAGKVVDYIASKLDWHAKRFRWFPFLNSDNSDICPDSRQKRQIPEEDTIINILLVDTNALNISNGTATTSAPGQEILDQVVSNFSNAVNEGVLSNIPVDLNGTLMILEVLSLGQCTDTLCNSTKFNVTELATAPPRTLSLTSGAKGSRFEQLYCIAVICFIMLFYFDGEF